MNAPPPIAPATLHYIFVDFENVQKIDPAVIGPENVRFTLLMGPLNKKLEMTVVEQLHKHPQTTKLVRLTSSGRNALDFAVAYYVGQAAAEDPNGHFHIVSKDKDFDPLVEHLRSTALRIFRHDSFDALALSRAPTMKSATRPKHKAPATKKAAPPGLEELADKALKHLRKDSTKPPKTLPKLISHLRTHFGKKIADAEVPPLVERLKSDGYVTVDGKGVVKYQL
jgi:PIN domain